LTLGAAVSACSFFPLTVSAGMGPLRWEQCISLARQHNPELRAAQQDLRAAEFSARGAFSGFLPELSGSASYSDTSNSGTSTIGREPQRSVALNARQNLFAGFRDRATVDQAEANKTVTQAGLRIVKARVSFDLKSAFAALRFAQDNVGLTQEIIGRREENLRLVELRFEGGRENKGSYYLSRAALSQARFEHLQAQQAVRVARERLARALGMDRDEEVRIAGTMPVSEPPASLELRVLLERTPEHLQAQAQARVAEADIGLARAGLLPNLDLSASAANVKEESLPDERRNSVSLQLTVPIYSGGRDYYATKGAVAGHSAAVARLEDTDRQTRTRLQQTYSDFIQAVEKLKVDRDFLEAANLRAEIARNRYNNGLLSFEDWDIIENDLIARQKAVLQSERERIVSEAAWEQAQGIGAIP